MRVEDLTINLRPRGPWESIDLGMQMVRHWAGAIYLPWLIIYFALAGVLILLLPDDLGTVALILWWLKPLYDRIMLFILSRAVFGQPPSAWETLTSPGSWLRTGLPFALTFARLNPARSFHLAIRQLEGLSGKRATQRRRTLNAQAHGHAAGLTLVWMHLEMVIWLSILGLGFLLVPSQLDFDWFGFWIEDEYGLVEPLILIAQLTATALLEPFYVGGGFALYLNRRSTLECWDLELAFRRLSNRISGKLPQGLAAGLALLLIITGSPDTAAKSPRKEAIEQIMQTEEFQDHETVSNWVRTTPEDDNDWGLSRYFDWLDGFDGMTDLVVWIAESGRVLLWVALIVIIVLILSRWQSIARLLGRSEPSIRKQPSPPSRIAGMDIRPESLPGDIGAAASEALRHGDSRLALSLLYRGSVSALVHSFDVKLGPSATETDVLQSARQTLQGPRLTYLQQLTDAWQSIAYAHRPPNESVIQTLCGSWSAVFGAPATQGNRP